MLLHFGREENMIYFVIVEVLTPHRSYLLTHQITLIQNQHVLLIPRDLLDIGL